MKQKILSSLLLLFSFGTLCAADVTTLRVNASERFQRITGFGGFVCSPTFGYGHMSSTEIKRIWGPSSVLGCNIVRLYIPIGRSSWGVSLSTAQLVRQMGLTVFASPWGQPAEWKTNNSSNGKDADGIEGHLKTENYADYADYLNDYASYLRDNGAALDAISIQNEPDWPSSYAGCVWTANEMSSFLKQYRSRIDCPVIAPETIGFSDSFAASMLSSDVRPHYDIYAAHQYGGLQNTYKQMANAGKEIWMTEYLINWQEAENSTRSFSWSKDAFNFANSINTCMLNGVNAWIHYAAKRFYAMMGDGTNGTTAGIITKRGYIMGQYSKYVTGTTRIGSTWTDNDNGLSGSTFLSQSGDSIIAVVINSSSQPTDLRFDLPFFTQGGFSVCTSQTQSMRQSAISLDTPHCRPVCTVPASSVNTYVWVKSADRDVDNMSSSRIRFDFIEALTPSSKSFGTSYKMSGKTLTFDHSHPLISSFTNTSNGVLTLNGRYDALVLHVNSLSSTMNLSSAATTLYYVNNLGAVSSHNYGDLSFSSTSDFDWVFDLSPATLPDGVQALLGLSNNNWSSVLTLNLGDVWLKAADDFAATLSGTFSPAASAWLDCLENEDCVWADLSGVAAVPAEIPFAAAYNANMLVRLPADAVSEQANVLVGSSCRQLLLRASGGSFRTPAPIDAAAVEIQVDAAPQWRTLVLPFATTLPAGGEAFVLRYVGTSLSADSLHEGDAIAAHTPLLIRSDASLVFTGSGPVSTQETSAVPGLIPNYSRVSLYAGDYVFTLSDGQPAFRRLSEGAVLNPFDVRLDVGNTAAPELLLLDVANAIQRVHLSESPTSAAVYDLSGRPVPHADVAAPRRQIQIQHGQKQINR